MVPHGRVSAGTVVARLLGAGQDGWVDDALHRVGDTLVADLGELVGTPIGCVWRIAASSESHRIVLDNMVALEVDGVFWVIECRQDGVTLVAASGADALVWRGGDLDSDEALTLVPIERHAVVPRLPLTVRQVEAWYTEGGREEFGLQFTGLDEALVLVFGRGGDFEIECVTTDDVLAHLQAVAHTGWTQGRVVLHAVVTHERTIVGTATY